MFLQLKSPNKNSSDSILEEYKKLPGEQIEKEGFKLALQLFKEAALRIPAYQDFLAKHNVKSEEINSPEDFQRVPVMDKKNYLRQYKLEELCWDGKLDKLSIISSSSGSTGKPFMWPRGEDQEKEGALVHELMLKDFFKIDKHKTLFINCFAMGTWIAGTYVLSSIERLSWKGYPIISVSPGIEKHLILQLFQELAPQFDQIILSGYPPFLKDVLDEGKQKNIEWKKYTIKFLFAAEGYSEGWRQYIHRSVGSDDAIATSFNCYGSADAGILAHETPLTNSIRQFIIQDISRMESLFSENRLPTLAQYDPRMKYFEELNGRLIFSSRSGIPLIRYDIGDNGGVSTYAAMKDKLTTLNYHNSHKDEWRLPFVWVFGRKDLTVSLYGLLIYPEHIKYGLEQAMLQGKISGKFVVSTENDDNLDQYLLVKVELASGEKSGRSLELQIQKQLMASLMKYNSEAYRLHQSIGDRALPVVQLLPHGDEHFRINAKQRWVQT